MTADRALSFLSAGAVYGIVALALLSVVADVGYAIARMFRRDK